MCSCTDVARHVCANEEEAHALPIQPNMEFEAEWAVPALCSTLSRTPENDLAAHVAV